MNGALQSTLPGRERFTPPDLHQREKHVRGQQQQQQQQQALPDLRAHGARETLPWTLHISRACRSVRVLLCGHKTKNTLHHRFSMYFGSSVLVGHPRDSAAHTAHASVAVSTRQGASFAATAIATVRKRKLLAMPVYPLFGGATPPLSSPQTRTRGEGSVHWRTPPPVLKLPCLLCTYCPGRLASPKPCVSFPEGLAGFM